MKKERILFIDDQATIAGGGIGPLMEILQGMGYDVECRDNPKDGIAAAQNHAFDIVFIDYRFDNAKVKGADIAREIAPRFPLLPLILISGYASEVETFDDCVDSGIHAVLEKQDEGSGVDESANRLIQAIDKAKKAVSAMTPDYGEDALVESSERFDAIEAACRGNAGRWERLTIEEIAEATSAIEWVDGSMDAEESRTWIDELRRRSVEPLNLVHVQDVLESAEAIWSPTKAKMAELESVCRDMAIQKAKIARRQGLEDPPMDQQDIFEAADRVWITGRQELTAQDAKDLWVRRKRGRELSEQKREIADRWAQDAKRAKDTLGRKTGNRTRWYQFLAVTKDGAVSRHGVVARVLLGENPGKWSHMRQNVEPAKKLIKHYGLDRKV